MGRDELLREVWGYRPGVRSRTLDTTVRRLRAKVEANPSKPDHILTEPGVGYRFQPIAPAAGPEVPGDELDAFIGRIDELARLQQVADDGARLVTLLGPGGVGKTRLAARWIRRHGGVVVELAGLSRASGVLPAVAAAAGLAQTAESAAIVRALLARGVDWVLLDNLEQLLPDAIEPVRALATAGELSILLTSRERLRIAGETVVEVPPLPVSDGIALLRARAPSALAGADDDALARICARLDGLPLALELAAGRAWLLGSKDLQAVLDRPLDALDQRRTGGRQGSLRSAILWSWRLLTPAHQQALSALTVFRGGFSVDAARAVLGDHTADPLGTLQELRDRSWLARRVESDGRTRLEMLQPLRELVLEEAPPSRDDADAHARHFASFGTDAARDDCERGPGQRRRALQGEWWNLLAATDHALERGADMVGVAGGCALALFEAARTAHPPDEVLPRVDAVSRLPDLPPSTRARILVSLADLHRGGGASPASFHAAAEATRLAVETGDPAAEALARTLTGILFQEQGELDEAEEHHHKALAAARAAGALRTEAVIRSNIGNVYMRRGQPTAARPWLEEAVAVHRRQGYDRLQAVALSNLALSWHEEGELGEAEACYMVALDLHRRMGNDRYVALVLGNIGSLALDRGDLRGAETHLLEAAALHQEVGNQRLEGIVRQSLAECLRRTGRFEQAREQARQSRQLAALCRFRPLRLVVEAIEGELMADEGHAHEGARRALESAERLDELGAPVEGAIARCRAARCEWLAGERRAAADIIATARTVLTAQGLQPTSELGVHIREYERLTTG